MNHFALRSSTILVSHDDALLCAGLAASLKRYPCFKVRVDGVDDHEPGEPAVDVVVTDYAHGLQLCDAGERARRRLAGARILVLTQSDREADIRRAIQAGVHGYVLVGAPLDELLEGVRAVADGVHYVCHSAAQRMADSLSHASLTSREVEVLGLVVVGDSNKAIARQLQIEVGTVKSHMSAIMTKLGATSRTQAARVAENRGLVEDRAAMYRSRLAQSADVGGSHSPRLQSAVHSLQ